MTERFQLGKKMAVMPEIHSQMCLQTSPLLFSMTIYSNVRYGSLSRSHVHKNLFAYDIICESYSITPTYLFQQTRAKPGAALQTHLSFIKLTDSFTISLRCRRTLMVEDRLVSNFQEHLNLEGHLNCFIGQELRLQQTGVFYLGVELHWEGSAPAA